MFVLKTFNKISVLAPKAATTVCIQSAGLKEFKPPKVYDGIDIPNKPKLRMMLKAPNYNAIRPPRMQKKLRLMRGPAEEHTSKLLHKQYGVIALQGGRIKYPHIELARLSIGRKMDLKRMFAVWRIPELWQPLHKKSVGVRLGGGKGSIDHYCTPVKAGRVILEIGGNCEFGEVKGILDHVAVSMPFKAMAVSQEILESMEQKKRLDKKRDANPFTKQYVIQNNLGGCHKWLSKFDHYWFGEYL